MVLQHVELSEVQFKRGFSRLAIGGIGSPIIINHEPVPAAGEECADVARLAVDVGGGGGGACLGVCLCDEDDAFEGEARLDAVGVVEAVAALAAREAGLLVNEIDLQGGRNYPGEEMWESLSSLDHILLSQKNEKASLPGDRVGHRTSSSRPRRLCRRICIGLKFY